MRILIIKLGAIGDVIRTTAILSGLRQKYEGCIIDWVTKNECFDAIKNNPFLGDIFIIGRDEKRFAGSNYDLVVCLDDDLEACALASNTNHKKLIGAYLENGERAYTKDSSLWFDMGLLSRYGKQKADQLKAQNKRTYQDMVYEILGIEYQKQEPILALDKAEKKFGAQFARKHAIGKNAVVIGINTGAGGRWEGKKLQIEKTSELIGKLNFALKGIGARIILFGGLQERERNNRIISAVKTDVIDAGCSNSLMQFASLVDLCTILITSDSLALHIGTALKKKIVAFFCPTSASEIELYSRGKKIIAKKGCLCCCKQKCDIEPQYDVDEIVEGVKSFL